MRQLLRIKHKLLIILFTLTAVFVSCDKDMNVSLDGTGENLGVTTVDSISVYTSTYQLTNLPSAGTGVILVGKVSDPDFGSIKSSSYFKLSLPLVFNDIPVGAQFDSINLVLKPNQARYFYGDTTTVQKISVHRVTQDIVSKDITNDLLDPNSVPVYVSGATIFNDQKFTYDATALGQASFQPRINSLDSVSVRLNQNFGLDIYNKLINNDAEVWTNTAFQNYLKGLVVVPDDQNTAVVGYNDTLQVNINYSYVGADGFIKRAIKTMPISSKGETFNNIEHDRTGTLFANLSKTNPEIKSTSTNGEVVLQAGTGLVAKIDFPSLNDFMYQENIAVNKIELVVEVKDTDRGLYPNPASLIMLKANRLGVPYSYVTSPFTNTIQQASFIPSTGLGNNGRYIFNLIDYIKGINQTSNQGVSIMLAAASTNLLSSINTIKLATENGKPKIKLNIVYTKFK